MKKSIKKRLEYLRAQLIAETISYGELAELQSLAGEIEPGDVQLLEAAGVPEFPPFSVSCQVLNPIELATASDVGVRQSEKVVISLFSIYNEAGQAIQHGFPSHKNAKLWAEENGYEVVSAFNINR